MNSIHRHFTGSLLFATSAMGVMAQPAFAGDKADVSLSGKMYAHYGFNLSEVPFDGYEEGDPRPNEFDIDRVYLTSKVKMNDTVSARITTDVGRTNDKKLELFIKYAYLQVKATDDIKLQFGAAGTAYVGMYDKFWGHRWLAKSFTDQEKILDSADLGVHASGAHADGLVSWGAAVVNGAGYGNPEDDASKAAQARLTVDPLKSGGEMSLPFTVFASKDVYTFEGEEGTTTLVGSVGFDHDVVTVWGEYVTTDDGDINGAGLSATLVGKVKDVADVVVRYDSWDPDTEIEEDAHTVLRAGVTHDFAKKISAGVMYEVTTLEALPDEPSKGVFVRMQAGF